MSCQYCIIVLCCYSAKFVVDNKFVHSFIQRNWFVVTNRAALQRSDGRRQQLLQRIKDGRMSTGRWSKRLQRRRDLCGRPGRRPSATIRALSGAHRDAGGRGGDGACRVRVGAARCPGRSRPPWSNTWRRRDDGVPVAESGWLTAPFRRQWQLQFPPFNVQSRSNIFLCFLCWMWVTVLQNISLTIKPEFCFKSYGKSACVNINILNASNSTQISGGKKQDLVLLISRFLCGMYGNPVPRNPVPHFPKFPPVYSFKSSMTSEIDSRLIITADCDNHWYVLVCSSIRWKGFKNRCYPHIARSVPVERTVENFRGSKMRLTVARKTKRVRGRKLSAT